MTAERIKVLREQRGYTQTELAKRLGITRASVNAWEMGISVPSTQYIVELAGIFNISTDYLLGVDRTSTVNIAGLNEEDINLVYALISHLKIKNGESL
ncbi:MAG: helix-turn-helix transcriptional regulator [Oscillospiraceae bacterium]|nr:helix-turn-helix transcriptional regulator [Oscillospiraceae bacterium]